MDARKKLKTLKDLTEAVIDRFDGESCFSETIDAVYKSEICEAAQEWIKQLEHLTNKRGAGIKFSGEIAWLEGKWKYGFVKRDVEPMVFWIKHFFNLDDKLSELVSSRKDSIKKTGELH